MVAVYFNFTFIDMFYKRTMILIELIEPSSIFSVTSYFMFNYSTTLQQVACKTKRQFHFSDISKIQDLQFHLHFLETVNTVCLGFSHEFTQFCQSWFYLQNGVKKVSRITYYQRRLRFFDCGVVFDLPAYFYPGHVTLFCHLTRKQYVYQNQKKEAGHFIKEILGCGTIKNTRFVAELNMFLIH